MKILILALVLFSGNVFAGGFVVVHLKNAADISESDIRAMFLSKTTSFRDGEPVILINKKPEDSVRLQFQKDVIQRSPAQVKAYWSKLVFTGMANYPKEVDSNDDVIQLVSRNQNAIGYIDSESMTDEVAKKIRVVHEF